VVLDRLDAALARPDRDNRPVPGHRPGLGGGGGAGDRAALRAAVPGRPGVGAGRAATTDGDSDSIACLTGAFHGAAHGMDAWPPEWAGRIEHGPELAALGALWD
jgi:hypothetical protein